MANYQVLIDVGSFLRYDKNNIVGQLLSERYLDHIIVYFDDNDQPVCLKNNKIISINLKTLKNERLLKVYFDQKHTVGIDLDLPSDAIALTTINSFNTHTQVVQGI